MRGNGRQCRNEVDGNGYEGVGDVAEVADHRAGHGHVDAGSSGRAFHGDAASADEARNGDAADGRAGQGQGAGNEDDAEA